MFGLLDGFSFVAGNIHIVAECGADYDTVCATLERIVEKKLGRGIIIAWQVGTTAIPPPHLKSQLLAQRIIPRPPRVAETGRYTN